MMNQHHMPAAGPPHMQQPAMPMHPQSRRHHEYHQFHQQTPLSPGHLNHNINPYAAYHNPYYGHPHPQHLPYPPPRWQPQPHQYPQYPMHSQPQYPPRSPLIVSSQPQLQPNTPVTRQPPLPYMPPPSQSPRPAAPPTPSTSIPQSAPSPRPLSSKPSTPVEPATTSRRSSTMAQQSPPTTRMPFYPQLPWYTPSSLPFPPKASKRRRKRQDLIFPNASVALPSREIAEEQIEGTELDQSDVTISAVASTSDQETPVTSQAPSEVGAAPSTPTPILTATTTEPSRPAAHTRKDTRTAVPIIPALPNIPMARPKTASSETTSIPPPLPQPAASEYVDDKPTAQPEVGTESQAADEASATSPPSRTAPKSWADLVRSKNASAKYASAALSGIAVGNGTGATRAESLAEALKQYNVENDEKIAFLEPRGLVNTGNMCYMNSILQILVFCTPFYNFLDSVSKRAAHSFKSDTPLVDAMIMFMREFKIIDSAESSEKLRMRLKDGELEQYGDSVIPEYVYDVIKRLPRFSSMRRGHQQDAEEFLGFLLAGMHDECVAVMRSQSADTGVQDTNQVASPTSTTSPISTDAGWLEVGPKQKAAVTRQSGDSNSPSPVTRIFGGALRSELRVPGLKNSVTLEPYQPLQLDIGAPNVNNIIDALKGLTKPETLIGDFNSPRGPGTTATKQVFIETVPPVLILHLKRFQYDNAGGTQKIWKKVGYPLHLEIPKEVFPAHKRGGLAAHGGEPKYRLISVVYHHGKSAAGGHYTVDILRQDEREWVRVDDTIIRRIRPEDVAEGGAEEDPKVLAKALEQHKADSESSKRNLFDGLDGDNEDAESVRSWNEVNVQGENKKKWSAAVAASGADGKATPKTGKSTPSRRDLGGVKDNKVAYILLYERVKG